MLAISRSSLEIPVAFLERFDRFLALEPPPPPDRLAFAHLDLTPEHLRMADGGELVGLLDWTDAGLGDPMTDLGFVAAWGGTAFVGALLDAYPRSLSADEHARLAFHRRRETLVNVVDMVAAGDSIEEWIPVVEQTFADA